MKIFVLDARRLVSGSPSASQITTTSLIKWVFEIENVHFILQSHLDKHHAMPTNPARQTTQPGTPPISTRRKRHHHGWCSQNPSHQHRKYNRTASWISSNERRDLKRSRKQVTRNGRRRRVDRVQPKKQIKAPASQNIKSVIVKAVGTSNQGS